MKTTEDLKKYKVTAIEPNQILFLETLEGNNWTVLDKVTSLAEGMKEISLTYTIKHTIPMVEEWPPLDNPHVALTSALLVYVEPRNR